VRRVINQRDERRRNRDLITAFEPPRTRVAVRNRHGNHRTNNAQVGPACEKRVGRKYRRNYAAKRRRREIAWARPGLDYRSQRIETRAWDRAPFVSQVKSVARVD
jgi:hypothetical protein